MKSLPRTLLRIALPALLVLVGAASSQAQLQPASPFGNSGNVIAILQSLFGSAQNAPAYGTIPGAGLTNASTAIPGYGSQQPALPFGLGGSGLEQGLAGQPSCPWCAQGGGGAGSCPWCQQNAAAGGGGGTCPYCPSGNCPWCQKQGSQSAAAEGAPGGSCPWCQNGNCPWCQNGNCPWCNQQNAPLPGGVTNFDQARLPVGQGVQSNQGLSLLGM